MPDVQRIHDYRGIVGLARLDKAVDQRLNAILQLFGCVVQIQEGTTSGVTCAVSPRAKLDRTITEPHDTNGESFEPIIQ